MTPSLRIDTAGTGDWADRDLAIEVVTLAITVDQRVRNLCDVQGRGRPLRDPLGQLWPGDVRVHRVAIGERCRFSLNRIATTTFSPVSSLVLLIGRGCSTARRPPLTGIRPVPSTR